MNDHDAELIEEMKINVDQISLPFRIRIACALELAKEGHLEYIEKAQFILSGVDCDCYRRRHRLVEMMEKYLEKPR